MFLAGLLILAATAPDANAPINVVGHAWAPFISPMGEPFRARTATDDTLVRWFNQADRNHDKVLTPDEMVADAERFFATLDSDADREIGPEELVNYEWELAPDVQVNSKLRLLPAEAATAPVSRQRDGRASESAGNWMNEGLQGAARYGLLNIPEPVAAADADFNRSISLAEFRQAALDRFRLLDSGKNNGVTLPQLETLRSGVLASLKLRKPRKGTPDSRIGAPLPPER